MSVYRPEFEAALQLLARVSTAMDDEGFQPPVLVGGAAVELYSAGAIATGDFDLVTARQDVFERLLQQHGFIKPSGRGVSTRGWIHPHLKLGVEVVGSALLDGLADRDFIRLFELDGAGLMAVIGIEDLIADRMGQYASGSAPEMLAQARQLFTLSKGLDDIYMERRIREETGGDYGISDLENES